MVDSRCGLIFLAGVEMNLKLFFTRYIRQHSESSVDVPLVINKGGHVWFGVVLGKIGT